MRKMRAKLLSYVLVVLMIMSLIPVSAFAGGEAMSDEFKAILNEKGEFEMYSVVPKSEDDVMKFFWDSEKMWNEYPDLWFDEFSDDYKSCVITNSQTDESHRVNIKYIYDESAMALVDGIVKKIPEGEYNEEYDYYESYLFEVKDMELVNYWLNNGDSCDLISYSGEFKELLGYKNFRIDGRKGDDAPFYTMVEGFAPFSYDGTVYDVVNIGAEAKHAIFVPDETGDTPEELQAAVLKRIEEYIGKGKVKIVDYGTNPLDIMLEGYDASIESAQEDVAREQGYLAEHEGFIADCEASGDTTSEDYQSLIEQLPDREESVQQAQENLESAQNAKQKYIDEYNTVGGENYYLNEAVGDYYFTMAVGEAEYSFVVIKDSKRMITPEYKSSDVRTGITVDSTDSSIPLDTLISVDELTSGKTYEDIMTVLNIDNCKSFDINLFSATLDKYITKLENGEFKVSIPITTEFKDKDLIVYYVDDNKEIHEFEVTVVGNEATFTTDHFSIYTLAEGTKTKENIKITVSEETVNEAIKNAGNKDTVVIPLDDKAENVTSVELPVTSLKKVADVKKEIQIETSVAVVTFDVKALEKIVKDAGANASITLNVDKIKKDKLNTKQQESIKDKTVEVVISAELLCNDKLIKEFGGGKVEVKVPFTPPKGTDGKDYKVLYVADDGKIEEIPTQFKDNCIIMELEHFSEYVIVKDVATQSGTNVKPGDNANLYLWFGLLGIGTVVAYKTRRKTIAE